MVSIKQAILGGKLASTRTFKPRFVKSVLPFVEVQCYILIWIE
jgi:hypothetical protein